MRDAATAVLVERGEKLADQSERAIRWAVALEGENNRLIDAVTIALGIVDEISSCTCPVGRCPKHELDDLLRGAL